MYLSDYLVKNNFTFIFIINNDSKSIDIIKSHGCAFKIYEILDEKFLSTLNSSETEDPIWVNDRLNTCEEEMKIIRNYFSKVVNIDDRGKGSAYATKKIDCLKVSINKSIEENLKFLILNSEVHKNKRLRNLDKKKVLVTFGGSDTHNLTKIICDQLYKLNYDFSIHLGPNYKERKELLKRYNSCEIFDSPKSAIEVFSNFDIAICGGGITPFELIAMGIPVLVMANEEFEIEIGEFIEKNNCGVFLGFWENYQIDNLKNGLEIYFNSYKMLANKCFSLNLERGPENVLKEILGTR